MARDLFHVVPDREAALLGPAEAEYIRFPLPEDVGKPEVELVQHTAAHAIDRPLLSFGQGRGEFDLSRLEHADGDRDDDDIRLVTAAVRENLNGLTGVVDPPNDGLQSDVQPAREMVGHLVVALRERGVLHSQLVAVVR